MSAAEPSSLDERYGRSLRQSRRSRLVAIIAAAVVFVVLVGWVVWAGLLGDSAQLEARDLGHSIVDDSRVLVEFEVTVEPGTQVDCAIQALNTGFSVVGWKTISLPPGERRTRSFTEELRTSELAVTGLIYRCWLA